MDVTLEREREKYDVTDSCESTPHNHNQKLSLGQRSPMSARSASKQRKHQPARPRSQSPPTHHHRNHHQAKRIRNNQHQHHRQSPKPKTPPETPKTPKVEEKTIPVPVPVVKEKKRSDWSSIETGRLAKVTQDLHQDEIMHRSAAKYYYRWAIFLVIPSNIFIAICGPGTVWSSVTSPDCTTNNISIPSLVFGIVSTLAIILTGLAAQFKFQKKQHENEELANKLGQLHASIQLELKKLSHVKTFTNYLEFLVQKIDKAKKDHENVSVPLHIRNTRDQVQSASAA